MLRALDASPRESQCSCVRWQLTCRPRPLPSFAPSMIPGRSSSCIRAPRYLMTPAPDTRPTSAHYTPAHVQTVQCSHSALHTHMLNDSRFGNAGSTSDQRRAATNTPGIHVSVVNLHIHQFGLLVDVLSLKCTMHEAAHGYPSTRWGWPGGSALIAGDFRKCAR